MLFVKTVFDKKEMFGLLFFEIIILIAIFHFGAIANINTLIKD